MITQFSRKITYDTVVPRSPLHKTGQVGPVLTFAVPPIPLPVRPIAIRKLPSGLKAPNKVMWPVGRPPQFNIRICSALVYIERIKLINESYININLKDQMP